MKKIILISIMLLSCLSLNGCILFHGYTPDVQQGNLLPANKVNRLRRTQTKQEVNTLLGTPVYINTFGTKWVYIYTYKTFGQPTQIKQVIITFRNNHVVNIQKDMDVDKTQLKKYHHYHHH